jgi:hypothetical protein
MAPKHPSTTLLAGSQAPRNQRRSAAAPQSHWAHGRAGATPPSRADDPGPSVPQVIIHGHTVRGIEPCRTRPRPRGSKGGGPLRARGREAEAWEGAGPALQAPDLPQQRLGLVLLLWGWEHEGGGDVSVMMVQAKGLGSSVLGCFTSQSDDDDDDDDADDADDADDGDDHHHHGHDVMSPQGGGFTAEGPPTD